MLKSYLFGILTVLAISTATNAVFMGTESESLSKIAFTFQSRVLEGGYIVFPLLGKCADREGENGHGWKFNVADYYGCDWLQRALNGNFKKPKKD